MKFPILQTPPRPRRARKPSWLKVPAPGGTRYEAIRRRLDALGLHTVCQEAHCPNIGECWEGGTATIMLMGGTCTRGCRFCAVDTGRPGPLDPREPENSAEAVAAMGVDYIVLTSVNRDDLQDGGAAHFAETIRALHRRQPDLLVEALIPDFEGRMPSVDAVLAAAPEVVAHNVETVQRLSRRVRDARANYAQSLDVLARIVDRGRAGNGRGGDILAKTSLMLGLGETRDEIEACLQDLRDRGVQVVTFGQYLQPTPRHLEVQEFVSPSVFDDMADLARGMGFAYVASGPLVRSSYKAGEFYLKALVMGQGKVSA